jgi:RNA polymerase sigma-70 factor (ECF subfamily)
MAGAIGLAERAASRAETARAAAPGLAEVFDAHAPFVLRALRCLGVRDAERDDACQEVFVVVHKKLGAFDGRASLRSWLYAICVRQAQRVRRTRARRREGHGDVPELATEASPHEDAERTRALAAAVAVLEELDDDRRAVLVLHDVEQLPMREVAEAVGCPEPTAYSRLYAARHDVKAILARRRANEAHTAAVRSARRVVR